MDVADFNYQLPPEAIAQRPLAERSAARMLCLSDGGVRDAGIMDLPGLLTADDLLVVNDTQVIPGRLFGTRPTGGRIEVMVDQLLGEARFMAQIRFSHAPKPGELLTVGGQPVRVIRGDGGFFELQLENDALPLLDWLMQAGQLPLPPYIQHAPDAEDAVRYQSVFAAHPGAVAAPTASLHFDERLLTALDARGVPRATVTLHVGAGTYQPVRVAAIEDHHMHAEHYVIPPETRAAIAATRQRGGRVVAVGTTVCRARESAADDQGLPQVGSGETRLFIYPGYRFQVIDRLLTNFHLPGSTLLMLVCAFAGREPVMAAYAHAVVSGYRFFSYGDAMWLAPETA